MTYTIEGLEAWLNKWDPDSIKVIYVEGDYAITRLEPSIYRIFSCVIKWHLSDGSINILDDIPDKLLFIFQCLKSSL